MNRTETLKRISNIFETLWDNGVHGEIRFSLHNGMPMIARIEQSSHLDKIEMDNIIKVECNKVDK